MLFSKQLKKQLTDDVELKEGEDKCSSCNGTGYLNIEDKSTFCPICHGTGKLTWTEVIVGKKNPLENIMMPLLRTFFPSSLASQVVSVQPMDNPSSVPYYIKSKVKNGRKKRTKIKS